MATRRSTAWLRTAAIAAACLISTRTLSAQEPGPDPFATSLAEQMFSDPAVEQAAYEGVAVDAVGSPLPGGPALARQPINWISGPYLKGGLTMAVGESLMESQDAGFTVSFGFRQPLMPAADERLFFDLGGSYLSAYGESSRVVPGLRTLANGTQAVIPNALRATTDEIQRGGVHVGLGWYWGDIFDVRSDDPQLRIATRVGGRLSHVRGQFVDERLVALPLGATLENLYGETDTAGGLFVGTELLLLNRDTAAGSVSWILDGEFANDWIDFSGWDRGSLGTASIMLGVMLSR